MALICNQVIELLKELSEKVNLNLIEQLLIDIDLESKTSSNVSFRVFQSDDRPLWFESEAMLEIC